MKQRFEDDTALLHQQAQHLQAQVSLLQKEVSVLQAPTNFRSNESVTAKDSITQGDVESSRDKSEMLARSVARQQEELRLLSLHVRDELNSAKKAALIPMWKERTLHEIAQGELRAVCAQEVRRLLQEEGSAIASEPNKDGSVAELRSEVEAQLASLREELVAQMMSGLVCDKDSEAVSHLDSIRTELTGVASTLAQQITEDGALIQELSERVAALNNAMLEQAPVAQQLDAKIAQLQTDITKLACNTKRQEEGDALAAVKKLEAQMLNVKTDMIKKLTHVQHKVEIASHKGDAERASGELRSQRSPYSSSGSSSDDGPTRTPRDSASTQMQSALMEAKEEIQCKLQDQLEGLRREMFGLRTEQVPELAVRAVNLEGRVDDLGERCGRLEESLEQETARRVSLTAIVHGKVGEIDAKLV